MPPKKKPIPPQTSLLDINDALAIANATVDTAVQALMHDDETSHLAVTLEQNVSRPLGVQRGKIYEVAAHLIQPRRRKKRAPNGSRKGKKRQRNRWKDRQKALKPWER